MSKTVYTCIVCPVSCEITVEETGDELIITGNQCKRGLRFAQAEHTFPVRMLTTTIAVEGGTLPRIPVISSEEIEKSKIEECLKELYKLKVKAPVNVGDIIATNICGTGVNIRASRTINKKEVV